jgi:heptosyltransferase-1
LKGASPKILIVKLSAIGDVVHTLPALNALRRHFPGAHIAWLVEEAAAELLVGHPALDRVLVSRRKAWLAGLKTRKREDYLKQAGAFLKELRDVRYDMILDFQAALKGALLIALARGDQKVGFGPGMEHQEHSHLVLNRKIPMVSMEMHALDRGMQMLRALGVPHDRIEYRLPITARARNKAARLVESASPAADQKPIAINPVAQWDTKLWSVERFARLADRLIESHRVLVFFTGGPGDRPVNDEIISAMRHGAVNLAGRTSLIELAALYREMACLVSTDTGPMHIAAAVNTPVVALFGPTAQWRTGPYGRGHRIVFSEQPCRPCFKRTCDTLYCMRAIGVDRVAEQVRLILDEGKNR